MSTILDEQRIANPSSNVGTSGTVRYFPSADFTDTDGRLWKADRKNYFTSNTWSLVGGEIVVPQIVFPSTVDGLPHGARFDAVLYNTAGKSIGNLFTNWQIPTGTLLTREFLIGYNGLAMPLRSVETLSRADFLLMLQQYVGAVLPAPLATTLLAGLAKLSVAPVSALNPIAVGDNDRRVTNSYNVKATEIGAIGDGTTNDRTALSRLANTTLQDVGAGGEIYFPAGDYSIQSDMTFPANVRLSFDPRARLKPANGVTITILGPINADPFQIFTNAVSGQGTISLNGNNAQGPILGNWWGAVGDDSTDNTAVIQAAITCAVNRALSTATSSTVALEYTPGIYLVSGALNQTATHNAQIMIPTVGTTEVGPRPQLIIRSTNHGSTPQPYGTIDGGANVLFRSTLTGKSYSGTYGLPCIMGAADPIHGTIYSLHTYLGVHLQGVGFKAPSNPTICGFNGSMLDSLIVEDALFTTSDLNVGYSTAVQPTAPTGLAVLMPLNNFNGSQYRGLNIATGWYGGFGIGELLTVSGSLYSVQNRVAFNLQAPWYHIADIGPGFCYSVRDNYGLAQVDPSSGIVSPSGIGPNNVTIIRGSISFEDAAAGWMVRTNHINDPSNKLIGYLDYIKVSTGVGADGLGLTKNGGTLITTRNLQNGWLFAWGTDNLQVRGGVGNNSSGTAGYATVETRSDLAVGEFNAYSSNHSTTSVRQKVGLISQTGSLGLLVGTNTPHGLDFITNGINLRGGYTSDGAFRFYGISAPAVSGAGNAHFYSTAGGKLQLSENGGAYLQVPKTLTGSASLDFAAWAGNDCQTLTIPVTGAVAGDVVQLGLPDSLASLTDIVWGQPWVSSAGVVSVRGCKVTAGASSNPAAATVTAIIIRH